MEKNIFISYNSDNVTRDHGVHASAEMSKLKSEPEHVVSGKTPVKVHRRTPGKVHRRTPGNSWKLLEFGFQKPADTLTKAVLNGIETLIV